MTRRLTPDTPLDSIKDEAKLLLKSVNDGDEGALTRVRRRIWIWELDQT